MEKILLILILFTQSCNSQKNDFNVEYENIEIDIPGKPGPWLKQNGKFYCYFLTDNDIYSSGSTHYFYILDKNGTIESKISVPDQLQTFYYDLYVKNDTIFTTEYYDQNTFFLDEKNKMKQKRELIYFMKMMSMKFILWILENGVVLLGSKIEKPISNMNLLLQVQSSTN